MGGPADLVLDDAGWRLEDEDAQTRRWSRPPGDLRLVRFFPDPAPPPFPVGDTAAARRFVRDLAVAQGQGIVEIDWVPLGSDPGLRTLVKEPQTPRGYTFIGHLSWHVGGRGWAVEVRCPETGTTGLRETAVALSLDVPAPSFLGRLFGQRDEWSADPYDPAIRTPVLRCRADGAEWDVQFPDHPLSRCRQHLQRVIEAARRR
jgi:hypothetical protein